MRFRTRVRNSVRLLILAGQYWNEDNASTAGAALAFYCALYFPAAIFMIRRLERWRLPLHILDGFFAAEVGPSGGGWSP